MRKFKVMVIGSGPAGYAAAIYLARATLKPLVMAGEKSGGQLMLTTEIENYPGFPKGILGPQLMTDMREQAQKFGAEIIDQEVQGVEFKQAKKRIIDKAKNNYGAEAVIIATGAESTLLGVLGETDYIGRGVSYCAVCDAAFFKGKRVFVVGGGDAAMEDTLALTKFARKITVIHRRDSFRASKIMQERVLSQKEKVEVLWNSEVTAVRGDGTKINQIMIKNVLTNEVSEEAAEGLFVAIGHKPATAFLEGQVELDEKGYVKTGVNYGGVDWLTGYPTMTSVPGVFAAGDNVDFRYRQAGTAAGFGIMAALDAEKWLENWPKV